MEDATTRLQQRYGARYHYDLLSEKQREFLLNSYVSENRDTADSTTVSIRNLSQKKGVTLLSLLDCHHFLFQNNSKGGAEGYAQSRLQGYRNVLGVEERHLRGQTYEFELPDHNRVRVKYNSIKDTV